MKVYLLHPRGAPNRPAAAYASRADLPIYSTDMDEVVEINVKLDSNAVEQLRRAIRDDFKGAVAVAFEKLTGEKL